MWILTRPKILYWQTADMGITEHIEGDECKFAAWTGRTPVVENKMILKVSKILIESYWDNIVFHYLYRPLPSKQSNCGSKSCVSSSRRLTLIPPCRPSSPNPPDFQGTKNTCDYCICLSIRLCICNYREFEDNASLDGSLENMERGSIASFGSGNTTDSEHLNHKVNNEGRSSHHH